MLVDMSRQGDQMQEMRLTAKDGTIMTIKADKHDGCKSAGTQPLPVKKTGDGVRFVADGAQTKTMYYLVEFGQ